MFHIVVLKKDTFQVVDDNIDSPVGGVPQLSVVASSRRNDLSFNHRLIKIGEWSLLRSLLNGCMEHSFPMFLNCLGHSFHRGQWLVYGQRDGYPVIPAATLLLGKALF